MCDGRRRGEIDGGRGTAALCDGAAGLDRPQTGARRHRRDVPAGGRAATIHGAAALVVLALLPALATAQDRGNCLLCHQYRGLSGYEMTDSGVGSYAGPGTQPGRSETGGTSQPSPGPTQTGRPDGGQQSFHVYFVDPDYVRELQGAHARLACTDCHERSHVSVIPHEPVTPVDCTRTCHLVDPSGLERRFGHANIAAMLEDSAHSTAVLGALPFAGGPLLGEGQSKCLYCHDEPLFRDPTRTIPAVRALSGRLFDRCNVCHAEAVPVDIQYYLRHIASRLQPARPTIEMAQVCAICHSDPHVLRDFELPDTVASYVRSFHGKAALLGDETTANCISCHVAAGKNAHLMLGPQDPRSSVNRAHVADSCRSTACHPGADPRLARTAVHLDLSSSIGKPEFALAAAFILLTILTFCPSAVLVLLELFHVLLERHHPARAQVRQLALAVLQHPLGARRLVRFTPAQRIQHWILVVLFTLLATTGFPLKFADRGWAAVLVNYFGGLHVTRLIHHWAGIALMAGLAFHLVYVFWAMQAGRRRPAAQSARPGLLRSIVTLPMWLGPGDGKKAVQLLLYLLFLRREPPTFGRFTVKEKFEYIGVFWGTMLLGITGLVLWGAQISTEFFSGRWLNLALIAHTYEAFLAIIHVGILHIINVILTPNVFPLSRATITGRTPVAELAENHGEFVTQVAAELGVSPPPAASGGSHG